MQHRRFIIGIVGVVLAAVVAGVYFIAIPAFVQAPDAVHIVVMRVQLPPQPPQGGPPPPGPIKTTIIFNERFTSHATPLYQQMVSGGAYTPGIGSSCPTSATGKPYYHYALTFYHLGMQVAAATSDAIDCQDIAVVYPGGSTQLYPSLYDGHSFWIQLHRLTGAPEPIGICMTIPSCHS